jgi:hypothetical protein
MPRHRPVEHAVIDDHRHDLERLGDAHHELLQVSHEDIGCADMVAPRERKPKVLANRLPGPIHHHLAAAHARSQQDMMNGVATDIPKDPQALALESVL